MKIRLIAGECSDGVDCPRVFETDEGRLVVQGYTIADQATLADLALDEGESAVWISAPLAGEARERGADLRWWARAADGGLIVRGTTVTDPDVLVELHLPRGESAVIPTPTLQEALL